jgi:hypothetical protein
LTICLSPTVHLLQDVHVYNYKESPPSFQQQQQQHWLQQQQQQQQGI